MEKLLQIQMNSRFQGGSDTLKKRLDARYRLIYGEARLAYKQQIDPESPALTRGAAGAHRRSRKTLPRHHETARQQFQTDFH